MRLLIGEGAGFEVQEVKEKVITTQRAETINVEQMQIKPAESIKEEVMNKDEQKENQEIPKSPEKDVDMKPAENLANVVTESKE